MLRITTKTAKKGSTLMVEGKLQGEGVRVLRDECRPYVESAARLAVDLSGVTFVDRDGIRLLRQLADSRVHLIHCSALIAELCKR